VCLCMYMCICVRVNASVWLLPLAVRMDLLDKWSKLCQPLQDMNSFWLSIHPHKVLVLVSVGEAVFTPEVRIIFSKRPQHCPK
jgi:hypothetical protein